MSTATRTKVLHVELSLVIDGASYNVHSDSELPRTVYLERWDSSGENHYELTAEKHYDQRETIAGGLACDCPDFRHRHRGTGSDGCKHIQAARKAGILRPYANAEPDEDTVPRETRTGTPIMDVSAFNASR